jgi:hypothetical protein
MKPRFLPIAAALALGLAFAAPRPASGQVQISFYPRAGLLAPDEYFYEIFQKFVDEEPTEWTTASLGRTGIFGIGADLRFGDGDIRLRGEIMHAFDGWLLASHSILIPRTLTRPPFVETVWADIPYDMTTTSLHVVLPTRLRIWKLEPYVSGGIGGKFYRFGEPTREWSPNAILPDDAFAWVGEVGAGLNAGLTSSLTLDLHVKDGISKYWDKVQNDFVFSAALVWRVY